MGGQVLAPEGWRPSGVSDSGESRPGHPGVPGTLGPGSEPGGRAGHAQGSRPYRRAGTGRRQWSRREQLCLFWRCACPACRPVEGPAADGPVPQAPWAPCPARALPAATEVPSPQAQLIAQSIGQAFSVAYQEFLRANGINPEDLSQKEYSDLVSSQEMYNDDLVHFSNSDNCKEVRPPQTPRCPAPAPRASWGEEGWGPSADLRPPAVLPASPGPEGSERAALCGEPGGRGVKTRGSGPEPGPWAQGRRL